MATNRSGGLLERGEIGFDTEKLSWAHWLVAGLATITGVVHIYLYLNQGFVPFLFAGVVFLAAVLGLLLNVYRRLLYAIGVPFTAGQIVIWVAQGMPDMAIAMIDKPIQAVLILLLVYLYLNEADLVGAA